VFGGGCAPELEHQRTPLLDVFEKALHELGWDAFFEPSAQLTDDVRHNQLADFAAHRCLIHQTRRAPAEGRLRPCARLE
jgi:hypothetical protein